MNSSEEAPGAGSAPVAAALPEDVLPIIPTRNLVLFPGVVQPVTIGRDKSIAAAREAQRSGRRVGFLLQKDPGTADPAPDELFHTGTVATVLRVIASEEEGASRHLICRGEQRFRIIDFLPGLPYLVARVEFLEEPPAADTDIEARTLYIRQLAEEVLGLLPQAPAELANAVRAIESPAVLADLIASLMDITPAEKQQILETVALTPRLDKVAELLTHRIEVLKLSRQIEQQTREALDERQKEVLLREQMRQIQKQLGEGGTQKDMEELARAVREAGMPPDVEEQARRELERLEHMPESGTEYSMQRTYIDWLIAMPWSKLDTEAIDIARARQVLENDHYGLEKVKRRILEFLAVRKLNPQGRSPILCLTGPPGVGKTSLGQSIARAVGLRFARVSLGGVHDEAEIRGHRRTYVGALPGNIVQALRKAGTRNPVLMLDEIDKLGSGMHGDPAAALLEVLDPEQNGTFRDNYLGVPFDLSKVLFITTANVLDTIAGPLRDRMEIIELSGYTEDEKVQIARRYLVARQLAANGLDAQQAQLTDEALHRIVRDYTREAGCRSLERQIGAVLRHLAVRIAEGAAAGPLQVGEQDLPDILGAPRFENEVAMRTSVPGVATGLAWTPVGGDILFIETTRVPGGGKLILTGQLGEVMKESAQAAVSLVKSLSASLGIETAAFEKSDLHIHVPAGAIPKDGPSAGVAIFTSLVSLLTQRNVRADVAMTGEISLRGLVLPVGGIKEKVVAATRAGIRKVLLPARNRRDYEDIPASVRELVQIVWIERVEQALAEAVGEDLPLAAPGELRGEAGHAGKEPSDRLQ
jgi:ATP-dependent Lon protease